MTMRALSATSTNLDAYEAGRELGEALAEIEPSLVIVFSSIQYDFTEQYEGLVDGLGREGVEVFGGTGDGYFETRGSSDIGVAALALSGEGLRFWVQVTPELSQDSCAAARRCAEGLMARTGGEAPKLALTLFDALACSDNRVIDGLDEVLDCPVFGGATSDDRKLERSYVLHNGVATANAVGVLGLGGAVEFAMSVENGTCPVGEFGVVEAANGNTLERIAGLSALDFVAQRLGRGAETFSDQDIGVLNFQCSKRPDMSDARYRSVANWHKDEGALETFGPVEVGDYVRVAIATSDELLEGVGAVLGQLERGQLGFEPVAALGISCAGRKWYLGQRFGEEVGAVRAREPGLPMIGFPSLGEVSPRRRADGSYSRNMFHNVSFVLALLGSSTP